jgi:hypothetical protein
MVDVASPLTSSPARRHRTEQSVSEESRHGEKPQYQQHTIPTDLSGPPLNKNGSDDNANDVYATPSKIPDDPHDSYQRENCDYDPKRSHRLTI